MFLDNVSMYALCGQLQAQLEEGTVELEIAEAQEIA